MVVEAFLGVRDRLESYMRHNKLAAVALGLSVTAALSFVCYRRNQRRITGQLMLYCQTGNVAAAKEMIIVHKLNPGVIHNDGTEGGFSVLEVAAYYNQVGIVNMMFADFPQAKLWVDRPGSRSPLHIASQKGHVDVLEALLGHGFDVNYPWTSERWTPLHVAARAGPQSLKCFRKLLLAGANPSALCAAGVSVVHLAASSGSVEQLRALLGLDASLSIEVETTLKNLHVESNGRTPLQQACQSGHEDAAGLLLDAGVDIDALDSLGWSALELAASEGHGAIVEKLMCAGASIKQVAAVVAGQVEDPSTRSLLNIGCYAYSTTENRTTQIDQMLTALLDRSDIQAQVNVAAGIHGTSPIHHACHGGLVAVRLLLDHGANPGAKSLPDGWTPLHFAAERGRTDSCLELLRRGADPTVVNTVGTSVLHSAINGGAMDVASMLLQRTRVPVNAQEITTGRTALHIAALRGHRHLVTLLKGYGADCSLVDIAGYTAAQVASRHGFVLLALEL